MTQQYAESSMVGPDTSVLIGSTDLEDAIAKAAGETALTIRAVGAQSVVRFRVAVK